MRNEEKSKDLLKSIEEGGIIDFVGPPNSGKTEFIKDLAAEAQKQGFHVELLNARNYHQRIYQKLEELAGLVKVHKKTLVVIDDCDVVTHLNDEALAMVQRSVFLLSQGEGRSVILVRSDTGKISSYSSNYFISSSSYSCVSRYYSNSNYKGHRAAAVAAGFLLGGIRGACFAAASRGLMQKHLSGIEKRTASFSYRLNRALADTKYRNRVTTAFSDVVMGAKPLNELDPEKISLLLHHNLLTKKQDRIELPVWLFEIFLISDLLTKRGQLNINKRRIIADVVNRSLYAQAVEDYLLHLSLTFDWLKDEMKIAGFMQEKKDYPLALFLEQTGQTPLEFLSRLFKKSDLVKLSFDSEAEGKTKEEMLQEFLKRWSNEDGAS